MKKILFGCWVHTISFIILFIVLIGSDIVIVYASLKALEDSVSVSDLAGWIELIVLCSSSALICLIIIGGRMIQFAVISENGIKIKTIFRTIRFLEWSLVKEIYYKKLYISFRYGFKTGWFVFDDGIEREQHVGGVTKKTHIVVPSSKRNRKIIEMFWHEPIIEKENKN